MIVYQEAGSPLLRAANEAQLYSVWPKDWTSPRAVAIDF